jgi:hypothetical protein
MNLNAKEGKYAILENRKRQGMNYSMIDPNINSTLLEKTLHEESFEKLQETILNPPDSHHPNEKINPNDMPLIEKITLGPIEKYQKWNRYPWKMIIHMFIIVMTSLQVLITLQADTNYSRNQGRLLHRIFLTPEGEDDDLSDRRERYLFTIDELKTFVRSSVNNYYTINDQSLEHYEYNKDQKGRMWGINADILKVNEDSFKQNHQYFRLNDKQLHPFDLPNDELKCKSSRRL